MALDRTWLLGTARHERDALGRTIQYADPARWDDPAPGDDWRARDVLAHLASTEVAAAQVAAGETPSEFDEFMKAEDRTRVDFHEFNRWAVARRAETPVISLAMEWGRAADLLLARAAKVDDEGWKRRVPWPVDEIPYHLFVQSRVAEWWAHGEDIRAATGLEPRIEHAPIHCVNDLSIRTIPYGLGLAGLSFPGRSVQIDLTVAGGGSWHYGLARGERPPPEKKPDAYIEGRAHEFALVAEQRADPDEFLYDGVLVLGGDVALARTVLEHVRTYV
jgi:uncharacterized protein (TIGR03084 family)